MAIVVCMSFYEYLWVCTSIDKYVWTIFATKILRKSGLFWFFVVWALFFPIMYENTKEILFAWKYPVTILCWPSHMVVLRLFVTSNTMSHGTIPMSHGTLLAPSLELLIMSLLVQVTRTLKPLKLEPVLGGGSQSTKTGQ